MWSEVVAPIMHCTSNSVTSSSWDPLSPKTCSNLIYLAHQEGFPPQSPNPPHPTHPAPTPLTPPTTKGAGPPPRRSADRLPFHRHINPGIPSSQSFLAWGRKVCPPGLFACLSDIIDRGIFWSASTGRRSDRLNLQCQAFQNHFALMLTAILHS